MLFTRFCARTSGFCCTFLASSKHNEEASCPKSGLAGFSRAKLVTCISGRTFFNEEANAFSHSLRKIAKGFSAIFTLNRISVVP